MSTITQYAEIHTAKLDRQAAEDAAKKARVAAKRAVGKTTADAFARAALQALGETFNENLTLGPASVPLGNVGAYMPEDYCGRYAINATRTSPRKILKFLPDAERLVTGGYLHVKARGTSLDAFVLEAHPGDHPFYKITAYEPRVYPYQNDIADAVEAFKKGVGVALAKHEMAGFLRNLNL